MGCPGSVSKVSACNAGQCLIPGLGRSPGGGCGNPLQYSCLENAMDRGAWRATVHRVTKSMAWLKQLSMHAVCALSFGFLNKVFHWVETFIFIKSTLFFILLIDSFVKSYFLLYFYFWLQWVFVVYRLCLLEVVGLLLVTVCWLLLELASLAVKHGFLGSQAQ